MNKLTILKKSAPGPFGRPYFEELEFTTQEELLALEPVIDGINTLGFKNLFISKGVGFDTEYELVVNLGQTKRKTIGKLDSIDGLDFPVQNETAPKHRDGTY